MISWIFESIISFLLDIMNALFGLFAYGFVGVIDLDFSSRTNIFTSTFVMSFTRTGVASFMPLLIAIGVGLAVIIFCVKLFIAIAPTTEEAEEGMISLGFRLAIAIIFVRFGYSLISQVMGWLNPVFEEFKQIAILNYNTTTFGSAFIDKMLDPGDFATHFLNDTNLASGLQNVVVGLVILVLTFTIFKEMLKLVGEIVERYVVFGVLFLLSPMSFGLLASKGTSRMFWSFIKMFGSQYLILCLNVFFITGFYFAMSNPPETDVLAIKQLSEGSVGTPSLMYFLIYMLMLLAWIKASQHIDEYLRGLGFSTAQTGRVSGMGGAGAIVAGAATRDFFQRMGKGVSGAAKAHKSGESMMGGFMNGAFPFFGKNKGGGGGDGSDPMKNTKMSGEERADATGINKNDKSREVSAFDKNGEATVTGGKDKKPVYKVGDPESKTSALGKDEHGNVVGFTEESIKRKLRDNEAKEAVNAAGWMPGHKESANTLDKNEAGKAVKAAYDNSEISRRLDLKHPDQVGFDGLDKQGPAAGVMNTKNGTIAMTGIHSLPIGSALSDDGVGAFRTKRSTSDFLARPKEAFGYGDADKVLNTKKANGAYTGFAEFSDGSRGKSVVMGDIDSVYYKDNFAAFNEAPGDSGWNSSGIRGHVNTYGDTIYDIRSDSGYYGNVGYTVMVDEYGNDIPGSATYANQREKSDVGDYTVPKASAGFKNPFSGTSQGQKA